MSSKLPCPTSGGLIKEEAGRGGEQLSSDGYPPPLTPRHPPCECIPYQAVCNLQHHTMVVLHTQQPSLAVE